MSDYPWRLLDGKALLAKLIKPCTSNCQAISCSLFGGLSGGSDNKETA
jgi:hypothetical protein